VTAASRLRLCDLWLAVERPSIYIYIYNWYHHFIAEKSQVQVTRAGWSYKSIIIAAVRRTAPITLRYVQFDIMEMLNCDKYAMCRCQIWMICYGLATELRIGFRVRVRVLHLIIYFLTGSVPHLSLCFINWCRVCTRRMQVHCTAALRAANATAQCCWFSSPVLMLRLACQNIIISCVAAVNDARGQEKSNIVSAVPPHILLSAVFTHIPDK